LHCHIGAAPPGPFHLAGKELVTGLSQPAQSAPLPPSAAPVRPRNGLGAAALVIGVASSVAGVSFVLFPLALVGGLVSLILGIIGLGDGARDQEMPMMSPAIVAAFAWSVLGRGIAEVQHAGLKGLCAP
jgi:hypothetical protein